MGRYEELKAREEAEQKKEKGVEIQKSLELERRLQASRKLQKLEKDKTELEARLVELFGEKKKAEESKEDHGYDMMAAGFERARKQAQFFFPELKFDKLDLIKVVHNGTLVDDDEVDLEGGNDYDPE
ncbi:hypothetical protein PIB30_093024 [Stylosanthes scabra]|uniref:Uncharacterized protein n=1 Tax=Stylosanthes scabra TaxID=79078 RepID=A0ABU6VTR3_9FABA|nr:hypothetical protein [Stylosanthes scabra]